MIKIKMYPADEGDAFLISFGKDSDINIIIDMGLKKTYEKQIKSDLIELSKRGQVIDLLVITHIDQDHIQGAIQFIKENGINHNIIRVKEVWYNSYRHLQFNKIANKRLTIDEANILKEISAQNSLSEHDGISEVSVEQGTTLAELLYRYSYNWNAIFKDGAVKTPYEIIEITRDVRVRLLSPDEEKLNLLARMWKQKLESEYYGFSFTEDSIFDDAFESYANGIKEPEFLTEISSSFEDRNFNTLLELEEIDPSITNGSSIAFIIEHANIKLLFLADSHEDIICKELESLSRQGYLLDFDVVKISHHGSNKNISNKLLNLISTKKFLISTNGAKHGHPNMECMAKIINAKYEKEIITNYYLPKLDYFLKINQEDFMPFSIINKNEIILG